MSDTINQNIIDEACASLTKNGYCLIENVLPPERAAAFGKRVVDQAEAERVSAAEFKYSDTAYGDDVNQWVNQLLNKGEIFRSLPLHPVARALATHVLGAEHLLSAIDSHITYPGNKPMQLHADQWWLPPAAMPGEDYIRHGDMQRDTLLVDDPSPAKHPITGPAVLNIMWMMSDFTIANGATRLVPGSHLSGGVPSGEVRDDEIQVEGNAGSLLAWEGRTWHASGLNTSNCPRIGLITYFGGPMIRTLTNYTLGLRSEVKSELSNELLGLLGFAVREGGYGMTDDPNATVARAGDETRGKLSIRDSKNSRSEEG